MELNEIEARIGELKKEIDALRPIDADTENRIMQKFRLDWNYHSNNLEGNSLTFGETKTFLLHGITAEGKPLKDHLDLKGHNEAILLLDDVIKQNRPLTETFIRGLHEIILHEPYTRPAKTPDGQTTTKRIEIGQYKKTPNHVETQTGEIFYFATPEETPAKMNDLMDWYRNATTENAIHPLEIAALFHYRFIRIHPFDDGNGRMARILMNLILMKYGYPPVIIKTQEKADYFRALQKADGGDETAFIIFIGEQLLHSLELYSKGAKGESIEDLDDVDKAIALLKAKLKEKSHRIIYDEDTAATIISDTIKPFLEILFEKLGRFDDMFHRKSTAFSIDYGAVINLLEKVGSVEELVGKITTASSNSNFKNKIIFNYNLFEFIKTDTTVFDISIRFELVINRYSFTVKMDKDVIAEEFYYHNKNDRSKFPKFANEVAKYILKKIEDNLLD